MEPFFPTIDEAVAMSATKSVAAVAAAFLAPSETSLHLPGAYINVHVPPFPLWVNPFCSSVDFRSGGLPFGPIAFRPASQIKGCTLFGVATAPYEESTWTSIVSVTRLKF